MAATQTSIDTDVERQLEAPMHFIGLYVAGASLLCTLAMAADTSHGFWRKRHWFPSRYFALNATSLTLLAVAMKLPMDLTTRMYAVTDRLAKVSSLAFMSTATANFLPSLGSMRDNDVFMNVVALAILVVTVTINVAIQVYQIHSYLNARVAFPEEILAIGSMLFLLVLFASTALMIPPTKRYLEKKYHEMHKIASKEEQDDKGRMCNDKLRVLIKKYWVMAETSSPQFVIVRSVTCTTSGVVSMIVALVLLEAELRMSTQVNILDQSISSYAWSTKWILISQTIGVIVGTVAPASRWFNAVKCRSKTEGSKSIKGVFTVEGYWTQKLVEWRQSSLSFQIRHLVSRKLLHHLRGMFLKLCISIQCVIVLASKLLLLISVYIISPIISCISYVRRLKRQTGLCHSVSEPTAQAELDIGPYVMLLEGEQKLSEETVEYILNEVDSVIQKGKKRKPANLSKFLNKSCNFNGVAEFDSHQIPSLHPEEVAPYCWSLPIVTLTSIALALPNVEKRKSEQLMKSVTEGISYVKLIDTILDKKDGLENIRTAADVVWVGVELYHRWQDKDLQETSLEGKNGAEILRQLGDRAETTVVEFERDERDYLMREPLNWPANVIAANSMYRISRTILLTQSEKTDDDLFEHLSVTIADVLAACLTNLGHVITVTCRRNAIEEREKSVRKAALLLGETEDIIAHLRQRELPLSAPDQGASVQEWRALIDTANNINRDFSSKTNIETGTSKCREEIVDIKVE
ncbi:hypothetical protein ABFS83_09G018800 [Erythranthe nasuta]